MGCFQISNAENKGRDWGGCFFGESKIDERKAAFVV
jgi:hypothetical protein